MTPAMTRGSVFTVLGSSQTYVVVADNEAGGVIRCYCGLPDLQSGHHKPQSEISERTVRVLPDAEVQALLAGLTHAITPHP